MITSRQQTTLICAVDINIVSKNATVILSMSANYAIGKIISQHASLYPQTPAGVQVYIQGEFETSSEV